MAIACCLCGELTEATATNTCLACETRRAQADATAPLAGALNRCPECRRVQLRGGKRPWHAYAPQSPELQRLCLQSLADLAKAAPKLLDARFAPTGEPDAGQPSPEDPEQQQQQPERELRLRLRLGITAGDFELQVEREAVVAVESVVCADCDHEARGWSWRAFVQLRFNSEYPRAFYRLEQELLRSKAASDGMAAVKGGVDVCFASKPAAERFVQQVTALAPVRTKTSSKTRSTDLSQHTANVQTTYCLELSPVAKHDLLVLPRKLAQALGAPQILLCAQTTSQLHLVDPATAKRFELSRDKYWLSEFVPWQTSAHLEDFVVLDVDEPERSSGGQAARDIEVARVRDFGVNDATFLVRSHLADSLQVGDRVKGYDLTTATMSVWVSYTLNGREVPEIVLVRPTASPEEADNDTAAVESHSSVDIKRLVEDDGGKKARGEARDFEAFAADYADELLLAA